MPGQKYLETYLMHHVEVYSAFLALCLILHLFQAFSAPDHGRKGLEYVYWIS